MRVLRVRYYKTITAALAIAALVPVGMMWALSTRHWTAELKLANHGSNDVALALSQDESLAASAGADGIVSVWDLTTGGLVGELKDLSNKPSGLEFSPDGTLVAVGFRDAPVVVWQLNTGQATTMSEDTVGADLMALTRDNGRLAIFLPQPNKILIYDLTTYELSCETPPKATHVDQTCLLEFSDSERALVMTGFGPTQSLGVTNIWDTSTGWPIFYDGNPHVRGAWSRAGGFGPPFTFEGHEVRIARCTVDWVIFFEGQPDEPFQRTSMQVRPSMVRADRGGMAIHRPPLKYGRTTPYAGDGLNVYGVTVDNLLLARANGQVEWARPARRWDPIMTWRSLALAGMLALLGAWLLVARPISSLGLAHSARRISRHGGSTT